MEGAREELASARGGASTGPTSAWLLRALPLWREEEAGVEAARAGGFGGGMIWIAPVDGVRTRAPEEELTRRWRGAGAELSCLL